jgi:hypothetical protein
VKPGKLIAQGMALRAKAGSGAGRITQMKTGGIFAKKPVPTQDDRNTFTADRSAAEMIDRKYSQ